MSSIDAEHLNWANPTARYSQYKCLAIASDIIVSKPASVSLYPSSWNWSWIVFRNKHERMSHTNDDPTGEFLPCPSMVQTTVQLMYCPNPIYLAFALSATYIQVVARRETMSLEIQRVRWGSCYIGVWVCTIHNIIMRDRQKGVEFHFRDAIKFIWNPGMYTKIGSLNKGEVYLEFQRYTKKMGM